jgi:hypothetical protein
LSPAAQPAGLADLPGQVPGPDTTRPLYPRPRVEAPRPPDVTRPRPTAHPLAGLTAQAADDRRARTARHRSSANL